MAFGHDVEGRAMNGPSTNKSATPPVDLAPADYCDPVIEAYKKDVDRTLLRENLKLTVEQRIRKAQRFHQSIEAWRGAARDHGPATMRENRS
jgi:hypothetical protein